MDAAINEETLKEIIELREVNDHGGAYQFAAEKLGCNELAMRFERINKRQIELGHLPVDLYEQRHRLYQELMAFARSNLSVAMYDRLYSAF